VTTTQPFVNSVIVTQIPAGSFSMMAPLANASASAIRTYRGQEGPPVARVTRLSAPGRSSTSLEYS
jgi:hypothetical protein